MIYCLEILNFRYIKFGFTSKDDLSKRIASLQTGCPFQIRAVAFVDGELRQEKELHKCLQNAFAQANIPIPPNEWYPGRSTIAKHVLEMLTQNGGGINRVLCHLDKYDPVNDVNSKDPYLVWPEVTSKTFAKELGCDPKSKPPKLRKGQSWSAKRSSDRGVDYKCGGSARNSERIN